MRLYHCYYYILLLPSAAITGVTTNSLERFDSRVAPPANARDVAGHRGGNPVTRMLRVQGTIDTDQRTIGTGFLSKVTATFGRVYPKKLLGHAKTNGLNLESSTSKTDRATKFLKDLTGKKLDSVTKGLVKKAKNARKAQKSKEDLEPSDTLLANHLETSYGDEVLAKVLLSLDNGANPAVQNVRNIMFKHWAAGGKNPEDVISLLKITQDVDMFEPGVTNFLLKFGKETKGSNFLIADVNAAILKHWDENPARYISGLWRWQAKGSSEEAKFIARSRYNWFLFRNANENGSREAMLNVLKYYQQGKPTKSGNFVKLTDNELNKVADDFDAVLKLVVR